MVLSFYSYQIALDYDYQVFAVLVSICFLFILRNHIYFKINLIITCFMYGSVRINIQGSIILAIKRTFNQGLLSLSVIRQIYIENNCNIKNRFSVCH